MVKCTIVLALLAGLALGQAHAGSDDTYIGPPRWVRGPKVDYPLELRRQGAQGLVVVRVKIGTDGKAMETRIHRSSSWVGLDHAAILAVREAQWETIAAPVWCLIPITFTLK